MIKFIRKYPMNRHGVQEIERSFEVEKTAHKFLGCGGRYTIEIEPGGDVTLSAVVIVDGALKDVLTETSENGPELLEAVDKIVRDSAAYLPVMQ